MCYGHCCDGTTSCFLELQINGPNNELFLFMFFNLNKASIHIIGEMVWFKELKCNIHVIIATYCSHCSRVSNL